jgi:hypothetical protein
MIVMKRIFILLALCLPALSLLSQKITDLVQQDTMVYVYKLNYEQMRFVIKNKTVTDTDFLFTKKFKEYPRSKFTRDTLPDGCYLAAYITGNQVTYQMELRTPFVLPTIVFTDEVVVYLTDKKSKEIIRNAKIEVDGKPIPYDPSTGGFTIEKKAIDKERMQRNEVFIRISYEAEVYAFQFHYNDNPPQPKPKNYYDNYYAELNSPGYLILDKPKYNKN